MADLRRRASLIERLIREALNQKAARANIARASAMVIIKLKFKKRLSEK